MKFPTVICDICNRPVDKLVQYDELGAGEMVLRAHCHGDTDEMRLTPYDLLKMTREQLDEINKGVGRAFTTNRIAQKETPDLADRG